MPQLSSLFFRSRQEWALCGVTVFWGATFLVVRMAMDLSGPLFFVGVRFGTAALLVLAMALPTLGAMTRRELLGGMGIGLAVFAGFSLQTMGLVTIPASKSAFLTAFYVPLVPLLEWLIMRHRPSSAALLGLALSFPGVLLLTGGGPVDGTPGGFGAGDILTMACAVCFALEIVLTGIIAPGCDTRRITAVELGTTSLLAFLLMPAMGEAVPPLSRGLLVMAMGLGAGSALMQCVIIWAQKSVPPTRATVIYTGEPVWGGVVGWLAGERLPWPALAGCALVVAGILAGGREGKRDGGRKRR